MKFVLMIMLLNIDTGAPTQVAMQEFGSKASCEAAAYEATTQCNNVYIDGGEQSVCFELSSVRASCLKAR